MDTVTAVGAIMIDHAGGIGRCPDKTRRRVRNEQLAHRDCKDDPLFGARKLLMLGAERLDARSRRRLDVLLAFGDPDGEVFEEWHAKENVRDLYRSGVNPTSHRYQDRNHRPAHHTA